MATSAREIAAKPWLERCLYSEMKTVQLDDPREAAAYLRHRAALLEILNNADAYVTIDGDPGSYPGAKPSEFAKVFSHDRRTIDRVGTHPKSQNSFRGFGPAGASRNCGGSRSRRIPRRL